MRPPAQSSTGGCSPQVVSRQLLGAQALLCPAGVMGWWEAVRGSPSGGRPSPHSPLPVHSPPAQQAQQDTQGEHAGHDAYCCREGHRPGGAGPGLCGWRVGVSWGPGADLRPSGEGTETDPLGREPQTPDGHCGGWGVGGHPEWEPSTVSPAPSEGAPPPAPESLGGPAHPEPPPERRAGEVPHSPGLRSI